MNLKNVFSCIKLKIKKSVLIGLSEVETISHVQLSRCCGYCALVTAHIGFERIKIFETEDENNIYYEKLEKLGCTNKNKAV